jgi:hypothetical protein
MKLTQREEWQEVFVDGSKTTAWLISVAQLKRSADVLWAQFEASKRLGDEAFAESSDIGINVVAWYLDALAFENLLKTCRLVEKISVPNPNGTIDWNCGDGHDQKTLAKGLKCYSFSKPEQRLLHRLSQVVRWAGRYPNPKKFEDFLVTYPQGAKLPPTITAESDRGMFEQMFKTLMNFAEEEVVGKHCAAPEEKAEG